MQIRLITSVSVVIAVGFVVAIGFALDTSSSRAGQVLAPFEFRPGPARTPEIAAQAMFLGVATASPKDYMQHVLIGVCENEIDLLQNFAESFHATRFSHDGETFTTYDLQHQRDASGGMRIIYRKKPIRVIASAVFDSTDPQVQALDLDLEAAGTYGGKRFVSVDVAGLDYDGREYQTRVVVAQGLGGWYAIPRCHSSKSFYEIADAMSIASADSKEAKQ